MNLSLWLKSGRLRVPSLILLLAALAPAALRADEPAFGPKKAEDVKKLEQLVKELDKNKVNVANWLRTTLGFSPELDGFPLDVHAYFDLPDAVKLRAAYQASENEKADSGSVLLELLEKRLALDAVQKGELQKEEDRKAATELAKEIVKLYTKLNPAFKLNDVQGLLVKFAFKPAPERPKLTDEERKRILVLAQYLEQSRNGGPLEALKRYFDLSASAAEALVWESGTVSLAFERAVAAKLEKEPKFLQQVIQRANEDALKHKDRTLQRTAILWSVTPKWEPGDGDLPSATPERTARIPEGPKAVLTDAQRAEIYRKDIEKAPSLKPVEVRNHADNPTGIFFASEVHADPALKMLEALSYKPGSDAATGQLIINFVDGTTRTLAPVSAEEAWMAYELAYGAGAAKAGDGIELLVLDGPHSYFEIKDNKLITAHRREVIVNPVLLGRELGLACARIDGMPRTRQWLLDEINADPVWSRFDKEQAARRRQVLEQEADWLFDPWTNLARKYGPHSSVFRVTDVPLYLHADNSRLFVERDDPEGRWSEPLRRSTFIEAEVVVQRYTARGTAIPGVKRPANYEVEAFKLLAELVPTSAELQRLNNFSAVLGVVRWAKSHNASFNAPAKPKEGPRTPEALAIFPEKTIPLAGHSKKEVLKQTVALLDEAMRKLSNNDQVKEFQDLCEKVIDAEDNDTREKAASKADKLSRTSAEVRLLEELIDAKYTEILLIDRQMSAKDDKKPDFPAEEERLEKLQVGLQKLKQESPAEFLIGASLLDRYARRLKEQSKVD